MKIAYILDTFPSLTETFIAREIEALRKIGFEITVFALNAGAGAYSIAPPPNMRWRGKLAKLLSDTVRVEHFKGLSLLSQQNEPEVWRGIEHVHGAWASHPALIAWGAAEALGVSWSFSGHARDLFVDGDHWIEKLNSARFATACTRAGQHFLQTAAPSNADKVLYAPHGLELERFPFQERQLPVAGEWHLLSVGRLVEKKGFDSLLQAIAKLREPEYSNANYSLRATIIGEGPLRSRLEKIRDRLNLQQNVILPGALPHEQVLDALHAADCFVLPCKIARDGDRDGIPNVLLEAAACGVPLVAARAGAVDEFVDDGTGWLCEPDDSAALARVMQEALAHPSEASARCRAARVRVEERFDIERNIKLLADAFKSCSIGVDL